jgi:putative tricarboxylic transport membrane protein
MDLTCKLARKPCRQAGRARPLQAELPAGRDRRGGLAYAGVAARAEPNTLVAFSGGSLLNLAQGKFGKATRGDVRWVAALGADYGMIAVRADSPYARWPTWWRR